MASQVTVKHAGLDAFQSSMGSFLPKRAQCDRVHRTWVARSLLSWNTHTHTWRDIHKILLKLNAQKINGSWDLIQKLKVGRRLATLNWFKRNTGRY